MHRLAAVENVDYVSMAESLDIGTIINKKMIAASICRKTFDGIAVQSWNP